MPAKSVRSRAGPSVVGNIDGVVAARTERSPPARSRSAARSTGGAGGAGGAGGGGSGGGGIAGGGVTVSTRVGVGALRTTTRAAGASRTGGGGAVTGGGGAVTMGGGGGGGGGGGTSRSTSTGVSAGAGGAARGGGTTTASTTAQSACATADAASQRAAVRELGVEAAIRGESAPGPVRSRGALRTEGPVSSVAAGCVLCYAVAPMDKLVIEGSVPLHGSIPVSGAKNAALPILCASLLTDGACTFRNVPRLRDVETMAALLRFMGMRTDAAPPVVQLDASTLQRPEAPYELVKQMRASVLVLGPLVARFGKAKVSLPGGCAIGARPIDQHLKGLELMGATIRLEHGYVYAECARLRGATIHLDMATVTGTENLMMAAALAKGRTQLVGAAREPEIEELARVLNKMGARVDGAGTDVIHIEGVESLHGVDHAIIPDRIEAGTFLLAAAAAGGDVLVENVVPEHVEPISARLRMTGCEIVREESGMRVRSGGAGSLRAVDITTAPHPGFPTDMQAQFMALMTLAKGTSVITESVFENRFMHVPELIRMGADIEVRGRAAVVNGVAGLSGASVMATDLRASASLVIAGLVAAGETEVLRVYHLDRGYEAIEKKLTPLGARVRRVQGSA